jgi:hypothetical protein
MLITEYYISYLINKYDRYLVSMEEGTWYLPQACQFLKLKHHFHFSFEKSIFIERTTQYIKDRNKEGFDDYFPCKKKREIQTITSDQLVKIICGF